MHLLFRSVVLVTASLATMAFSPRVPHIAAQQADPTAPPCPVDQRVCDFAITLNGWLQSGDVDAVVARTRSVETVCDRETRGSGSGFAPLCRGVPDGEGRAGYVIVGEWLVGGVVPQAALRAS